MFLVLMFFCPKKIKSEVNANKRDSQVRLSKYTKWAKDASQHTEKYCRNGGALCVKKVMASLAFSGGNRSGKLSRSGLGHRRISTYFYGTRAACAHGQGARA